MKILHCSDLHYSLDAIQWIEQNRDNYDVICLTGDFLDDSLYTTTPVSEQVSFFTTWFEAFSQPLFVCSGNHDYFQGSLSWLAKRNSLHGDGSITTLNGIIFGCIGYETQDFSPYTDCNIILYHTPPKGSSCAKQGGNDYGCSEIKHALKHTLSNANYLLCGHVHQPKKHAIRLGDTIVSNSGGIHKNNQASHSVIEA